MWLSVGDITCILKKRKVSSSEENNFPKWLRTETHLIPKFWAVAGYIVSNKLKRNLWE